jgi:anaerobic selenocysteine-containing dehydrogenase
MLMSGDKAKQLGLEPLCRIVACAVAGGAPVPMLLAPIPAVRKALESLDFMMVIDVMETASMPWADVVIPVTSMYECDHPFEVSGNWLMARNRVVEPLGEYKSDYEFWLDLGVRMGYGKDFWHGSIEECMDYQLENFGIFSEHVKGCS